MINRNSIPGALFCILVLYARANAQLVFPHFAQGGGYQTAFTLTNLSGTAATATIQMFPDSGRALPNLTISLQPNGTGKSVLSGQVLETGWARLTVIPTVEVAALETIQLFGTGAAVAETSVLPAATNTTFRFPAANRDSITTGIALANPGMVSSTVTVSLRDQGGVVVADHLLSLSPEQHVARFITEFFHGIGAFEGSMEVSGTSPVAVLAVRQWPSGTFSVLPVASPAAATADSLFSPAGGIAGRLVREIQRASTSIDIAIYTFTENEIAAALIAAKNRGVSIRIIADSQEASAVGSVVSRLESAGFQLKRTAGIGTGIMHNKYAIFDRQTLFTGSYNWSASAETRNFENAIFIRDSGVISSYQANFNSIWNTR
jgi:hypothetical protein